MKGSRFTETQIIAILKEAETGMLVKDVCRQHGISDATYCNWKAKYGGLAASDLKHMKEMEAELSRLKRMYADIALENRALKGEGKGDRKSSLSPFLRSGFAGVDSDSATQWLRNHPGGRR